MSVVFLQRIFYYLFNFSTESSREKIKPEKELQRAEKQILKCKLGIRDVIHQLDLLSSIGSIEDSAIYPDGSVSHEHIFCAKCKSREAFPDNDIILCDGTCNCGFHQKCLEPPLEKIPPGDQGWFCKFCESKMKILEAINAHLCTNFTLNSTSEDIFKEATGHPDVDSSYLDPAEEWPSEDSADEDYNPEVNDNRNSRASSEDYVSGDSSISGSQLYSLDEVMSYYESDSHSDPGGFSHVKRDSGTDNSIVNTEFGECNGCEILSYRRKHRDVDYRKLHDEMFGKDFSESEQQSEDEDWGPYRRKHRRIESSADPGSTDPVEDGCSKMTSSDKLLSNKKLLFRIPASAVKELRQVFAENELPSRTVKENLSKKLGLSSEKVSKWFKNARYAALKIRKGKLTSHVTNVNKGSRASAGEAGCSDLMDNSYFLPLSEIIRVPKQMSRILHRKKPKSAGSILRKQHKRPANARHADKIQWPVTSVKQIMLKELSLLHSQVCTSIMNTARHKRWLGSRRRHSYLKKADEAKESSDPQQLDKVIDKDSLYVSVIESLSSLQNRLQNLQEALLSCKDTDHISTETYSLDKRVMYVPFAEVKEKA
ncbi:pathogenesis-related homeodomain protein isoform X2 [Typha latifolia]|uniref:pathogenesis-related homeodomain protein isoform X2 n=1 Tax=Typha latifolia TaxID=4733 RepID=UPI003C2F0C8A